MSEFLPDHFDHCGAEIVTYWDDYVNIMAADVLNTMLPGHLQSWYMYLL